jgi:hypothetical protein
LGYDKTYSKKAKFNLLDYLCLSIIYKYKDECKNLINIVITYDLNTIYQFLLQNRQKDDYIKELINLSFTIRNTIKKTNIMRKQSLINYNEISSKLEHIYLKYKKHLGLNDGKDLLVILIKLKNNQL